MKKIFCLETEQKKDRVSDQAELRCFSSYSQIMARPASLLRPPQPQFQLLTWLLSLADTSAMLFLLAWCTVRAARVAPPATLTMHWAGGGRRKVRMATSCGNTGTSVAEPSK